MQDVQVTARRTCPLGIRWIRGHVRVLTLRNIACCLGRHPPPRQQHQRYLPAAGRPCGQSAVSQARQTAERAVRLRRPRPLRCTGGSRRRAGQRGCSSGTTTTSDSDLSIKAVERTASPRRKEATAWSGGAELFGRGDPGERAGGNDSDAVASGPDRRSDPGGLGTPTPRALILSRNSAWE